MIAVRKRIVPTAAALLIVLAQGAWAQIESPSVNPFQPSRNGLAVSDVSVFSSYYSVARPSFSITDTQSLGLGYDVASGVQGTVGWSRSGTRTSSGIQYTGSYISRARYPEWNVNNHALHIWSDKPLGQAWDVHFSAEGAIRSLDQFLFEPERLASFASLPSSFEDLAAAMSRGDYSNQQLASMLTGLPVVATPAQTLIYGSRNFTSGASLALSYNHSSRLRFLFGAGAGRMQALSPAQGEQRALLDHSTLGNASVGLSYTMTPRTELAFSAGAGRSFSTLSDRYSMMGTMTVSRSLTHQWFASVEAGGGGYVEVRSVADSPSKPGQYLAGITLARRSRSQTWMFSGKRAMLDSYGVGAHTSTVLDMAWNWRRPGSAWSLMASAAHQSMDQSYLNALSTWQTRTGLGRRLSSEMAMRLEYAYMDYRMQGALQPNLLPHASVHALRVVLDWSPQSPR